VLLLLWKGWWFFPVMGPGGCAELGQLLGWLEKNHGGSSCKVCFQVD